jgi:membrane protease subunit HflK
VVPVFGQPCARGDAQRILESANAYRDQVVARSEGEADRFLALLTEYSQAKEVTRNRLYLDAVEEVMTATSKVLMDVEGGNQMIYLPLDRLAGGNAPGPQSIGAGNRDMVRDIADAVVGEIESRTGSSSSSRSPR